MRSAHTLLEFAQVARVRRRSWWIESQALLCGEDETCIQQEERQLQDETACWQAMRTDCCCCGDAAAHEVQAMRALLRFSASLLVSGGATMVSAAWHMRSIDTDDVSLRRGCMRRRATACKQRVQLICCADR
jgi:hypothetical protein